MTRHEMHSTRRPSACGVLLAWCVAAIAGCATGGESVEMEADERRVPVEVADHTIDSSSNLDRNVRPNVDVRMEQGQLIGIDRASYEGRVRSGAVRCYRKKLRRSQSEREGSVVYEVLVTRNGRVTGTDVMSTGMRERRFKSCLRDVLSHLRFDIPSGRRPVYRLFFRMKFQIETIVPDEPPV